jgi:hypothetical protein
MADENRRRKEPYWPFRKAESLVGSSLFWLPVSGFPMRQPEKAWVIEFDRQFTLAMKEKLKFRQENFINFDFIYPDLMTPFLKHASEFNPVPGMLVQPSQEVFRAPTEKEIQDIIASGDASKVRNATKNIVYWLPKNKGAKQLTIFGGYGALMSIWLPPCPKTKPPDFRIPPKILENPNFKPLNIPGEIELTFALADSFLPNSLKVFAPDIKDNPQYSGMAFAIPLITSRDILTTPGDVRELWLSLMGAYLAESRDDQGLLLWGRPDIDPLVKQILEGMLEQEIIYPSA